MSLLRINDYINEIGQYTNPIDIRQVIKNILFRIVDGHSFDQQEKQDKLADLVLACQSKAEWFQILKQLLLELQRLEKIQQYQQKVKKKGQTDI